MKQFLKKLLGNKWYCNLFHDSVGINNNWHCTICNITKRKKITDDCLGIK